jgi:hypothetical protein
MSSQKVRSIGSDRQLFVDDYWIAESNGVTRVLHEPTRREPVIEKDYPWEEGYVGDLTTAYDGEKYRMWYGCEDVHFIGGRGAPNRLKAYAESEDGIHWTKPFLHQEEFGGSKENNLLKVAPRVANIDKNPDCKEEERFKGFKVMGRREKSAIYPMASPDGINWHPIGKDPILTGWPFDSKNLFFWDDWTGQYRAYTRGVANNDPNVDPATVESQVGHEFIGGVRWIRWSTSPDFQTWRPLEDIDCGDTPYEHLYTNECWPYDRAPGTYLMFPSRYVAHRTPDPDWYGGPGLNDIVFMSSRDGVHFDRSFMEAFIRPGLDKRNWHERGIYFQHGIYQTSPTELTMYVNEHIKTPGIHVRRYTIRPDGFVSVKAGYAGGELTTHPLTFEGKELELNYSTSAVGTVKVEVQDEKGNALPGYGLDDCPEMFADEIEGLVRWKGGSDINSLAGKPVRLRFSLNDADVYAFRFR